MIRIALNLNKEPAMTHFHQFKINSFFLILAAASSLEAASIFPRGCEVSGFAYQNQYLILNETGKQAYYLIQNHSESKIEIEHEAPDEAFMSPPLHASFEPKNWGAFASDVKELNFTCYKNIEGNSTIIDCKEVLEICQYPRVRFALSNMGNYWVSFDKSQTSVIEESVAKGIYLKW